MRSFPSGVLAAAVLFAAIPAAPVGAADPCADPEAFESYACKVQRLRQRSFVVVAVPDTGINPYHAAFRLPADEDMQGVPPWEYIEGYPTDAESIDLTLDAEYYDKAVATDQAEWSKVESDSLYYVPGTRIIGAIDVTDTTGGDGVPLTNPPILDVNGHGTAAASLAAGSTFGFNRDLDTLIVAVQGWTLDWVSEQPWIDVISNSWGYAANVSGFNNEVKPQSKAATDRGAVVAFAGGNGVSGLGLACDRAITLPSHTAGPPWNLVVGAVSPKNDQDHCWHSVPVDVSSYGSFVPAAEPDSLDGERNFSGTSSATPLVAGVVARQILEARRAFGDHVEGPHGNAALAVAAGPSPASGPLADGVLTREEVEATTMRTAYPVDFDPGDCLGDPATCGNTTPTTPAYFTYQGYGVVNAESALRAQDALFGRAPMPERTDVDTWMTVKDSVAAAYWGVFP